MKTVVLDDDPTGTQSACGVQVLLDWDVDLLTTALAEAESVYVQTNSRALNERAAVDLVRRIRAEGLEAGERLGAQVRFVLRGDSTLRGHVFAESEVFVEGDAVLLFVPAFPDGGRTTRDGVHLVRIGDREVPAAETEYAADPVFPFAHSQLTEYVAEKSGRRGVAVPLNEVRSGSLASELLAAEAGSVVLPDAVDQRDIEAIANAVLLAESRGRQVVVRCAAPLAAELAGVTSDGLLASPVADGARSALLVCGSHTAGASNQLAAVAALCGAPIAVSTDGALVDPVAAGTTVASEAEEQLNAGDGVVIIASERVRSDEHNTLEHGERVMRALTTAVQQLLPRVDVVIAKGGITSADVARHGIGARIATVLGQVLPGVSVWRVHDRTGRELLYFVVPGNVGGSDTLVRVLDAIRFSSVQAVHS